MTRDDEGMPVQLGFRMPAEWHPHRATWLAWPHNEETWPENLEAAQAEYVRLVETIAHGETACVIAPADALPQARSKLAHLSNVEFFDIPTNDAWIRDHGPTFVIHPAGDVAAVAWRYNGWGGKYPPFDQDQRVARRVAERAGVRVFSSDRVVEGGALEINSRGDLLTTISCLLNPNRNPVSGIDGLSEQAAAPLVEAFHAAFSAHLASMLGASSVNWLAGADVAGDDTDGHIDQQVRFADDDCVLLVRGHAANDPQDEAFRQTINELRDTFSADLELKGMDLPLPPPRTLYGRKIPASYLNFYICNYGIIVPQFDEPLADARAIDIIKSAFPGRRIIGLPSLNLTVGLGSFHCLTQQEPMPENTGR
jgi:agmatine deiminase